jgi:hypothetical protein
MGWEREEVSRRASCEERNVGKEVGKKAIKIGEGVI